MHEDLQSLLVAPAEPNPLQPQHPMQLVKELKAPVLGLYGGADAGIPTDTVERMQQALKEAGKPSKIILYPDTPHGFFGSKRTVWHSGSGHGIGAPS
jgi:carboxymethylenebutenolidase